MISVPSGSEIKNLTAVKREAVVNGTVGGVPTISSTTLKVRFLFSISIFQFPAIGLTSTHLPHFREGGRVEGKHPHVQRVQRDVWGLQVVCVCVCIV